MAKTSFKSGGSYGKPSPSFGGTGKNNVPKQGGSPTRLNRGPR